jgi:phospholipase C
MKLPGWLRSILEIRTVEEHPMSDPIKHVIVLVLENHSFDLQTTLPLGMFRQILALRSCLSC